MTCAIPDPPGHDHTVEFYRSDGDLTRHVARYVTEGIRAGEPVVVVVTDEHLVMLEVELRRLGVGVNDVREQGLLVLLDAHDTLASLAPNGAVDRGRFDAIIGDLLTSAPAPPGRIRVFGEMVALLWADGFVAQALELEEMWNVVQERLPFSVYCAYPVDDTAEDPRICERHRNIRLAPLAPGEPGGRALNLAPGSGSSKTARTFVASVLDTWQRTLLLDSARLVTSELVANAIEHAQTPFMVTVAPDRDRIRISVTDGSPGLPVVSDDPSSTGGFGMRVVDALALEWGTTETAHGKTTWVIIGA